YFLVAVVFIWITSDYLDVVDVDWLTMLLGTVLFFFALSRLFNFHFTVPPQYESALSVPLGAVNGILTGLTGSFMVPSVLYMQAIGLRGDMLVQAMGIFFSISVFTLAVSLERNDLISAEQAQLSLLALIPSIIGLLIGRWTRRQIDEDRFQYIFLMSVLVLGGYIVVRSARALGYL
ncbi:MAG: sulfite exporter TauE/SafE family protein, partial [Gammaproteobacteria bacterium]